MESQVEYRPTCSALGGFLLLCMDNFTMINWNYVINICNRHNLQHACACTHTHTDALLLLTSHMTKMWMKALGLLIPALFCIASITNDGIIYSNAAKKGCLVIKVLMSMLLFVTHHYIQTIKAFTWWWVRGSFFNLKLKTRKLLLVNFTASGLVHKSVYLLLIKGRRFIQKAAEAGGCGKSSFIVPTLRREGRINAFWALFPTLIQQLRQTLQQPYTTYWHFLMAV